jgi:hypothetical protein
MTKNDWDWDFMITDEQERQEFFNFYQSSLKLREVVGL